MGDAVAGPTSLPVFGQESVTDDESAALVAAVHVTDPRAEQPSRVFRLRRDDLELFLCGFIRGAALTVGSR